MEKLAIKLDLKGGEKPDIVAKGLGVTADKIIEFAEKHNIPIYKDQELALYLFQLNIGEINDDKLTEILLEIFAFINEIDRSI